MRLHPSSMIPAAAVVAFALVAGQAASLYAEAIDLRAVAATAVTASSYYSEGEGSGAEGLPRQASDWSGMTGAFPNGVASTGWYTSWASEYHDPPDFLHEWIEWDLGGTYTLSKAHVWNFNEDGYTTQGIKKLDIQKWTGAAWENAYTGLTWSEAPNTGDYAGFDQEFSTPITTSKIRFANLVNYGNIYGAGVGEVVFYGVPEPGTLVLLGMAGLGLLAYAWRRRRS